MRAVPIGGSRRGRSFFDQWNLNFNLSWELDFWGRFRRAIQSADATLDASVFDYDEAIVTLLSDTASDYVDDPHDARANQAAGRRD